MIDYSNTTIEPEEAVQNGALVLDNLMPGWYEKIDLTTLDISSACDCVLGQLYESEANYLDENGYNHAVNNLLPYGQAPYMLGFTNSTNCTWEELDNAWIELIDARLH